MKISPKYSSEVYAKLEFSSEEEWQVAIDIFEDRIRNRFLKFAAKIESQEFAGFVIMAIDCLLIETLNQFYKGISESPRRGSRDFFVDFLTCSLFKEDFPTREIAGLFYDQIRCGILHQAEVKGSSLLRIDPDLPLVKFSEDKRGLIINRRKFHEKLACEIDTYVSTLRKGEDEPIRRKFKEKMDYICRLSPIE